jgi:nitric oxide reductase large subunit
MTRRSVVRIIALYYMQGLNTTAVHGHTALFGVYGMLGIGLMLFCLKGPGTRGRAATLVTLVQLKPTCAAPWRYRQHRTVPSFIER